MILYCHIGNRGLFRWNGLQTLQKSNDGFVSYISHPDHHHTTFMIQVHRHNNQICSSVKILQKLIFHARRVQSSHFWSIIFMRWHIFTKSKKKMRIWQKGEWSRILYQPGRSNHDLRFVLCPPSCTLERLYQKISFSKCFVHWFL